jgi:hypothetical protein
MDASRADLLTHLEAYYRDCGWKVERADDGTVRASGLGGVTWIGLPVTSADLADPSFAGRLAELAEERMPTGELCPLELLPSPDCSDELRQVLVDLRLGGRGHVEVYSLAA